jgi:hypothetical protein
VRLQKKLHFLYFYYSIHRYVAKEAGLTQLGDIAWTKPAQYHPNLSGFAHEVRKS